MHGLNNTQNKTHTQQLPSLAAPPQPPRVLKRLHMVALCSAPLRWLVQPPLPLLGETFVFDICRPPRQDLDLGWGGAEPPEPPPVTAGLGGRTRWGSGHYYKVQQFFVFDSGHRVVQSSKQQADVCTRLSC